MSRIGLGLGGLALVHVAAFIFTLLEIEPFYTFFYMWAWWTYILALSLINHHRGRNSLLIDQPREFLWVFTYSVVVWLFFEAYNLRLENWHYLGAPVEPVIRLPGYPLAYGTVLPGIFETVKVLENYRVFEGLEGKKLSVGPGLRWRLILNGLLMMLAPLVSPMLFFPLVWVGLILILDPILFQAGDRVDSILRRAEEGEYTLLTRFLVAGLLCGFLWEFWNYWAGSKWYYTIPYFNFWKIFEMPLVGFLGFPFFAIECYLLYQVLLLGRQRFQSRTAGVVALIVGLAFCVFVVWQLERSTIESWKYVL